MPEWDTRVQLHWAAQIPAGVGRTLIARRSDDSNTAFRWSPEREALMQKPVGGIEAGIRLRDLTIIANDDELPLRGRTLDDGFAFLESRFGAKLNRPNVDLPGHAVARGAEFEPDETRLATLAGYYAHAAALLETVKGSAVLCWPHHFDIATLHTLDGGKSIGIGFSPGDDGIREPYWYVNLWPYPNPARLPALRYGVWYTRGWIGAVLPAGSGNPREFVREAAEHCRALLA
jgi:hypothetical protein